MALQADQLPTDPRHQGDPVNPVVLSVNLPLSPPCQQSQAKQDTSAFDMNSCLLEDSGVA